MTRPHLIWAIIFGHVILIGMVVCAADFAARAFAEGRVGLALAVAGAIGFSTVLGSRAWVRRGSPVAVFAVLALSAPVEAPPTENWHTEEFSLKAQAASDRLRALARACAEPPRE